MKLVATVRLFTHLFQNDLLYSFKNVATVSSSMSSFAETESAIYVTMLCPEQFFSHSEHSINIW